MMITRMFVSQHLLHLHIGFKRGDAGRAPGIQYQVLSNPFAVVEPELAILFEEGI